MRSTITLTKRVPASPSAVSVTVTGSTAYNAAQWNTARAHSCILSSSVWHTSRSLGSEMLTTCAAAACLAPALAWYLLSGSWAGEEASEAHRQASQQAGFQVYLALDAEANMVCQFKLASSACHSGYFL